MRNLRCVRHSVRKLPTDALPLTATAWDTSAGSLICTFGPSKSSATIELKRLTDETRATSGAFSLVASWDAPCPLPELACDKVLCLQFFPDKLTSCLVLAGGDIVIVREEPLPGNAMIEIVGSVDAGITAAAWSPDEELLAMATRANTLLYMTRDFENVTSITLTPEDANASSHVSVGWGRAETQFKGKRAQALRDPTVPEKIDQGLLSSMDDGSIAIAWRGDGAYLAVNSIESNRRMIRVYSREGTLDSASEPVDFLEGALSWRPAGNIIAGVQRRDDQIDVVFFERNGLRHGEFSLRLSPDEMHSWASSISLCWNADSTVLAVCFKSRVQLWTMGNYHYYLKQEIMFGKESSAATVEPRWHPERALSLSLSAPYTSGCFEYVFAVARSSIVQPNDFGTIAVIDGKLLKVTPLRLANVPPPMALHELILDSNVIDVAINQSSTLIAVLHEMEVCVFRYNISSKEAQSPVLASRHGFDTRMDNPRQITFRGDLDMFVLLDPDGVDQSAICYKTLDQAVFTLLPLDTPKLHTVVASVDYSKLYSLDDRGAVSSIAPDVAGGLSPLCTFPAKPAWFEVASNGNEHIAFGLAGSGSLYANERLLAKNCTSFMVTATHLIFTTTQHLLKFVHISSVEAIDVPPDEPEKDERCRSIERGARLVSAMPSSYSVVLQMPRGNLETIFPRALVVAGIRNSIAEKKYEEAFMACRRQRVDMNILHDHMPGQFMASLQLFLDQLKEIGHVDLFLSHLRNENVTQTMYKETGKCIDSASLYGNRGSDSRFEITTKVNRICDAVLEVLQKRANANLQNIITANVCKTPPDLEGGLAVVASLRQQDASLAEKAAEHMCFLADANQLYDHALGLYNLDVALLIAQQSQKDPREYLPHLQSLQEMTAHRRMFTIDDNLGRRVRALAHLRDADVFGQFKAYAEKHELHSNAIAMCKHQPEKLKEMMKLYASHLNSRGRFKEAGIAFEHLSDYASASDAYRAANMWRESLSCATAVPLPTTAVQLLAEGLAAGLTETKDFYAAATVQLDYLDDLEAAARTFCRGYCFAEALRVVGLRGRLDLFEAVVDPGLVEGSASMTELLADCKGQITAQVPRLRELRAKKYEDPLAFLDDGGDDSGNIADDVSVAPTDTSTSMGTLMTRYTTRSSGTGTLGTAATRRTSKNRRREERKRARGKKGSVYEEEYLVGSIVRLIDRVNMVNDDVGLLVEGLMRRGMRERAAAVTAAMAEVVALCRDCADEVFMVENEVAVLEGGSSGEVRAMDGVGSVCCWEPKKEAPVVKAFARLSLVE